MSRARVWLAVAFGAFLFLAISALVARALTATAAERADVRRAVEAAARGDVRAVLALTPACARQRACVSATAAWLPRTRRAGPVQILQYRPSAEVALTRRVGTGRVAWRGGDGRPVVQCVRVRREGPLTGAAVELLSVSAPIAGHASCP